MTLFSRSAGGGLTSRRKVLLFLCRSCQVVVTWVPILGAELGVVFGPPTAPSLPSEMRQQFR